jgi:hypothetical protein
MNKSLMLAALFGVLLFSTTHAQEAAEAQEAEPIAFTAAEGALNFKAPGEWTKVQPRVNFIEAEFSIPKIDGDPKNGRLTIMGAGGSIQANIDRWYTQFTQPDGGATSEVAKVSETTVNEMTVHMVDITGTYMDTTGGPFNPNAKKVERENYRMVAAIIETADNGNYFVKMYGPQDTMEKNLEGFQNMVKGLELAD